MEKYHTVAMLELYKNAELEIEKVVVKYMQKIGVLSETDKMDNEMANDAMTEMIDSLLKAAQSYKEVL